MDQNANALRLNDFYAQTPVIVSNFPYTTGVGISAGERVKTKGVGHALYRLQA